MSDKTKLRWLSGSVIKQGDVSSEFEIKLWTENKDTLNGEAKLQLIHSSKGMIELKTTVTDNVIVFKLEKALPVGNYIVEVEHAGYVFPSTDSIFLTVNENIGDFASEKAVELYGLKDIIKKIVIENKTEAESQEVPDLLMFYNIAKI